MAKVLGPDLLPLLRDLHFDERALHSDVHRLQTSAFPREQASGTARDLVGQIERSGIQISSVGSLCQSELTEWHTEVGQHSESKREASEGCGWYDTFRETGT